MEKCSNGGGGGGGIYDELDQLVDLMTKDKAAMSTKISQLEVGTCKLYALIIHKHMYIHTTYIHTTYMHTYNSIQLSRVDNAASVMTTMTAVCIHKYFGQELRKVREKKWTDQCN